MSISQSSGQAVDRLAVHGLGRRFGTNTVLRDVDLTLRIGEVVGLVGENGAGKSTLLNIVSGTLAPTTGTIETFGRPRRISSYREANRLGIFRVFQEPALFPNLTVAQNMFMGWERLFRSARPGESRRRLRAAASAALAAVSSHPIDLDAPVSLLSPSARQTIDIARVTALAGLLAIEHPVICFDEPTANLDQQNEENFLNLLDLVRGRATVVFVSHRLPEILQTTDRIIVLKDGVITGELVSSETDEAGIHELMVGRVRAQNYYRESDQAVLDEERPRLSVRHLSADDVDDVSFDVSRGEVLGLVGVEGSGKSTVGRALFGAAGTRSGVIEVDGRRVGGAVSGAMSHGIVYIPADRLQEGLLPDASIATNIQLSLLADTLTNRWTVWRRRASRDLAERLVCDLDIVCTSIDQPVSELSGGNQQKVLLARWLARDPAVVVLDSPTQGVDTGARESIYELVRSVSASGAAVVLISDDLPEAIGLSHRLAVLREGRITHVIPAPRGNKPDESVVVAEMIATAAVLVP